MRTPQKSVKFTAGIPTSASLAVAVTRFDGCVTTLLVHPQYRRRFPMPGERWLVEIERRPLTINRKKKVATTYCWPIRLAGPVASATPFDVVIRQDRHYLASA